MSFLLFFYYKRAHLKNETAVTGKITYLSTKYNFIFIHLSSSMGCARPLKLDVHTPSLNAARYHDNQMEGSETPEIKTLDDIRDDKNKFWVRKFLD